MNVAANCANAGSGAAALVAIVVVVVAQLIVSAPFHHRAKVRVCSTCNEYMTGVDKNMSQSEKKSLSSAAGTILLI